MKNRNDKRLTVLIPFINEGEEVAATVRDVRRTAGDSVNILVVNDCSTIGLDTLSYKILYFN